MQALPRPLEPRVSAGGGASAKRGRSSAVGRLERRRRRLGLLFLVPLAAVNLFVVIGPSVASVYYAFTNWTGLGPARFIGLENFRTLLADGAFRQALLHNLIWTAIFLTIPVGIGLLGAFLLSQVRRFRLFFRIAFLAPSIVATVVTAAIWQNILDPSQGIGSVLARFHIGLLKNVAFFGSTHLALPAVAFVNLWQWWGFLVVLFFAAMQSVDRQLYEAARVDGANRWQEFRFVTLPGIKPTLMFMLLMTIIWSLVVFDYVFILTGGGPAGASEVVATLLYRDAFSNFEAGYAAAMGLTMSFVSVFVVLGYLSLRRRGWDI